MSGEIPYGYCHCGCGELTTIATQTRDGRIKGQPSRFLIGHNRRAWVYAPGDRVGDLIVEREAGVDAKGHLVYLVRCACGAGFEARGTRLRDGSTDSCGCLKRQRLGDQARAQMTTHGMTGTGTFRSWASMVQRCTNPRATGWKYYGGRADSDGGLVRIAPQWLDFATFLSDMGERPEGKTLYRIDPDGNYEPGNCRWASPAEQARDRRRRS